MAGREVSSPMCRWHQQSNARNSDLTFSIYFWTITIATTGWRGFGWLYPWVIEKKEFWGHLGFNASVLVIVMKEQISIITDPDPKQADKTKL